MNSCELVTLVSSLAYAITKSCSPEEAAVIAAVLVQLGDSITTILASQELCNR